MKKYTIALLVCLQGIFAFGQNPEIKPDLPTVIPPSPTVAALMKFEETPVSNYTGIPDISVPLFSSPTLSKDITLNLDLKYHPNSVKPETVAGDTGLGWSLFAGGAISRTVRGMPDEVYDTQNFYNGSGKIGIYHTQGNYRNKYNQLFNYIVNGDNTFDDFGFNEYLFDVVDKNKMDTEYDLWQFNFMGKSGRFLIIKNTINNTLEIKNLDLAKEVEIKINYNSTTFVVNSFEVYDDKGYKYIFDVIETTLNSTTVTTQNFVPGNDMVSSLNEDDIFNSAFNLTKIYSPNNKLLLEFSYTQFANNDYTHTKTEEFSEPLNIVVGVDMADYIHAENSVCPGAVNSMGPKFVSTTQQTKVNTKKIKNIDIINIAKIDFEYQFGRLDSKLVNAQNSLILKNITIRNWNEDFIKKINLNHTYKTTMYKRLILESLEFQNNSQSNVEKYSFEYKDIPLSYLQETFTKDAFGYLTIIPYYVSNSYYNQVNPDYAYIDVLQKIIYPTKGAVVFDFQSNTYSYEGNVLLSNYNDNIKNWNTVDETVYFSTLTNTYQNFFTISQPQNVYLTSTLNVSSSDFRFEIYKFENNSYTYVGGIDESTCPNGNCSLAVNNLLPGVYKVRFTSVDQNFPNSFNASIKVVFKEYNNNYQYNFGGGIRINKIGYFKNNVNKNIFDQNNTESPEKLIKYDYSNNNLSNGALVSIKPKFEYEYFLQKVSDISGCITASGSCTRNLTAAYPMKKFTTYNNIKGIQTQGSDIGYSAVKVIENLKGYTTFEYTSPIDYPEVRNDFYPFLISENFDFKRGLLKKQTTYNESGKELNQTIFTYQIDEAAEHDKIYGLNFYVNYDGSIEDKLLYYNPFSPYASNYDFYNNNVIQNPYDCPLGFGSIPMTKPVDYIHFAIQKEAFGWAKLTSKNTKNYFYTGSTPSIVETTETYTYNPLNKKIASQTTTNSNTNEVLKTDFTYHTGNSIYSQNRISEIEKVETFRNGTLLSTSKINYSNTFVNNAAYLPQSITAAKNTQALENRLKYNAYDEFGNPLEVQQEGGITIAYIWGYNNSQPIAKIENATYAAIQSQATALQNLSNTGTEANLIAALNSLRTSLPNAMVTTYTYKPLIGISTMTDPKGNKTTYEYDEFNRLKQVKDQDGNILSENQYQYRTQN